MAFNVGTAIGYLDLDTSGFQKGFQSALKDLKVFKDDSATATDKLSALGSATKEVGSTLTKKVTLPIVGLGTAAVGVAANFESAMSQVQATMGVTSDSTSELNGQTVNTMDALSGLAKEMGEKTKFSASEAAAAINNMAMAGYKTQDIFEALPGVLSLASAGGLDLDYATQLAANGLNVMGMGVGDINELSDKLAVTASNAYGSVSDFGEGLLIAGAQAKLTNVSLTDTFTALGILGDNGISASEGGTYLRNTLKNLYTPTEAAAKQLEELGVQTSNSDGTLRDFQSVLQDLGGALDNLSDDERVKAMNNIFDTRTISAANALIDNSKDRWDELSATIDNAGGAAEQMANTQLDNLQGQMTILKSALEGVAIGFGELLIPVVKDVVGWLQKLLDWINGLNEDQKDFIKNVALVVAAVGPILLVISKVIGAIKGVIKVGKLLAKGIGLLISNPIALIIAAVVALVAGLVVLYKKNEKFRDFVDTAWGKIKDTISNVVDAIKTFFTETIPNAIDSVKKFFESLGDKVKSIFTEVIPGAIDAVIEWFKKLADNIGKFFTETLPQAISDFGDTLKTFFTETVPEAIEAVIEWFAKLPERIGYWLGYAVGKVARWVVDTWNEAKEIGPKVIDAVVTFFKELPGKIKEHLETALKNFVDWATKLKDNAKEKISEVFNTVVNFFKQLPGKIKEHLSTAFKNFADWAKNVKNEAKQKISDTINTIVNYFKELPGKIKSKLSEALDKVKTWGSDTLKAAKESMKEVVTGIIRAFKDLPGDMVSIGKNLLKGLVKGITSMVKSVVDSVKHVGSKVIEGFKDAFNIHSPSRETVTLGIMLMRGLAKGMSDSMSLVRREVEAVSDMVTDTFDKTLPTARQLNLGVEALEQGVTAKSRLSSQSSGPVTAGSSISNTYVFNSPKAVTPTVAAKLMKQTAQQLSMSIT